ncbi:MAG TPA: PQQ-dependent sugar dehydrogenase [Blastocatellia bacterium]|nr:PQQ-dependent sugar dehydrogenase [Blastocatellia bacterium]
MIKTHLVSAGWTVRTLVGLCCLALCLNLVALVKSQAPSPQAPPQPAVLNGPEGFKISVFASEIAGARLMAVSPDGVLYVTRQLKGDVVALPDRNRDGQADSVEIIASGLTRPHSLAFHQGYLYLATNPAILRMKYSGGKPQGEPEKVVDLPVSQTSHWTRTVGFGRDGKMYVSIGSSCNSCEEDDARRTTIMQYQADGSGGRAFAKGLRNAIGFDWDPQTGALWAVDMAQDKLGEEKPPDEINRIEDGKHYGWPYFVANNEPNPDLKDPKSSLKAEQAVPPAFELQPHSSPIDLTFYRGQQFPAPYRNAMFVSLHGSSPTARKEKIGYKVVRMVVKDGRLTGAEDFITGWLKDGQVLGRPAGLITGADGALYISDDNKGFIYRVTYEKK